MNAETPRRREDAGPGADQTHGLLFFPFFSLRLGTSAFNSSVPARTIGLRQLTPVDVCLPQLTSDRIFQIEPTAGGVSMTGEMWMRSIWPRRLRRAFVGQRTRKRDASDAAKWSVWTAPGHSGSSHSGDTESVVQNCALSCTFEIGCLSSHVKAIPFKPIRKRPWRVRNAGYCPRGRARR